MHVRRKCKWFDRDVLTARLQERVQGEKSRHINSSIGARVLFVVQSALGMEAHLTRDLEEKMGDYCRTSITNTHPHQIQECAESVKQALQEQLKELHYNASSQVGADAQMTAYFEAKLPAYQQALEQLEVMDGEQFQGLLEQSSELVKAFHQQEKVTARDTPELTQRDFSRR